jgi:hypothetical protein
MAANYDALGSNNNPSPYGSGDPYYNQSSGYITPHKPVRKRTSNWIKFGVPLLVVVVIVAVVVGVVVGTRKSTTSSRAANAGSSGDAAASSAASAKLAVGRFAIATDSEFMVPIYPSTVSL